MTTASSFAPASAERTAAAELLMRLAENGVENLFGNAGTDSASIIEAYADAQALGLRVPNPVTVPHENLAVAMAHGAYLASGRPQAVMVHVSVGTANTICGLLNGSRENVPIILLAGRTPVMEQGPIGSRNAFIHWGQEMFDQASMVRESVKWDYELRRADQVSIVVDRAVSVAMSHPRGPVYVSLPREILAEPVAPLSERAGLPAPVPTVRPAVSALTEAVRLLTAARRPVLVTSSLGREARESAALERFATSQGVPVISYRTRYAALANSSSANVGYEIGDHLVDADLILVAECDVPWIPNYHQVNAGAKLIHIGTDPLFQRYPIRSFHADLMLPGDATDTLDTLAETPTDERTSLRLERLVQKRAAFERQVLAARNASDGRLTSARVAACLARMLDDEDIIVAETGFPVGLLKIARPGTYFAPPSAGGLGWGLGAGLGIKIRSPDRRVVTIVGDGAYMFGNPTPAHYVSVAGGWPVLTIILNNRMWAGVRRATLSLYPDGAASRTNDPVFTSLEPSPRYEKVVEASGGYGEYVKREADLDAAMRRALRAIDVERRPAVLNIAIAYSDEEAKADAKR